MPKKNEVLEMLDKRVEEVDKSELILFIPIAEEEVAFVKKKLTSCTKQRCKPARCTA